MNTVDIFFIFLVSGIGIISMGLFFLLEYITNSYERRVDSGNVIEALLDVIGARDVNHYEKALIRKSSILISLGLVWVLWLMPYAVIAAE